MNLCFVLLARPVGLLSNTEYESTNIESRRSEDPKSKSLSRESESEIISPTSHAVIEITTKAYINKFTLSEV